jgi:hypothetical protein
MITKDAIQQVFDQLLKQGNMDTKEPLLYGYFFTDADGAKLFAVSEELEKLGYKYVDIFEPDVDEADDAVYYLHVEKVETHTVDSLDLRNKEFYKFADKYNLESYDGFDVGNVDFDPSK